MIVCSDLHECQEIGYLRFYEGEGYDFVGCLEKGKATKTESLSEKSTGWGKVNDIGIHPRAPVVILRKRN